MTKRFLTKDPLQKYPKPLLDGLVKIAQKRNEIVFVAGGAVREWYAGDDSRDLDLTVVSDALGWTRDLASILGGAFVPLDEKLGVARLVWEGLTVDFTEFRGNAGTIEEDLQLRDFTINAMAVVFSAETHGMLEPFEIIDPTHGAGDFDQKIIRMTSAGVFDDDPLRMLRAYRFKARFGFEIEPDTEQLIQQKVHLIKKCAGERIAAELALIMVSGRAYETICSLNDSGLLGQLFPELMAGSGVEQPASHHLDVLDHNLEALKQMEEILASPEVFFSGEYDDLVAYAGTESTRELLLWSALFHDIGKPETLKMRHERLTFHNHDRAGGRLFAGVSRRLAWSNKNRHRVCRLIDNHMWPFHLNNVLRKEKKVTPKACLRLVKAAENDLQGVFLLAMADSMAGQGSEKPDDMEASLAHLYDEVNKVYQQHIKPVLAMPRLLTGHDLQEEFELSPGPLFSEIFSKLEEVQVNGEVKSRTDALEWVKSYLEKAEE